MLPFTVVIPAYNESDKIESTVLRVKQTGLTEDIVVIDDGSSDDTKERAERAGAKVISLGRVYGVGAALRAGFHSVKSRASVIVVMAGNNKDEPKEIPKLLEALQQGADFVQGSRYLVGGRAQGGMPIYRRVATRIHPILFSFFVGKKVTESTNGFRAFRTALLEDPRIDLNQKWLDHYELEPYFLFKVITLGYSHTEVPVTKTYPPRGQTYTKMRPFSGWWSLLRPIFILGLRLRR